MERLHPGRDRSAASSTTARPGPRVETAASTSTSCAPPTISSTPLFFLLQRRGGVQRFSAHFRPLLGSDRSLLLHLSGERIDARAQVLQSSQQRRVADLLLLLEVLGVLQLV